MLLGIGLRKSMTVIPLTLNLDCSAESADDAPTWTPGPLNQTGSSSFRLSETKLFTFVYTIRHAMALATRMPHVYHKALDVVFLGLISIGLLRPLNSGLTPRHPDHGRHL